MEYTANLNSLATPEQIVKQLSCSLQSNWVEDADGLTQNGRESRFGGLTKVASSTAEISRVRSGQLAESNTQNFGSDSTSQRGITRHPGTSKSVNLMAQGNEWQTQQCMWCKKKHNVATYYKFPGPETAARWEGARKLRLLLACPKCHHLAGECSNWTRGNAVGCGDRRHQVLQTIARRPH